MDSITQLTLGASIAAAGVKKELRRKAAFAGALLGTLPDLDVIIRYADPIDNFTYHRGFSHSLFVLVIVALVVSPLLKSWLKPISLKRALTISLLILITHPILDALTSYGTQLFWPTTTTPIYIASIFIIDFFYTVPLLIGLMAYLISYRLSWMNQLGLLLSSLYLLVGLVIQQQAKSHFLTLVPASQPRDWFVTPLGASPFCWRGVYVADGYYHEMVYNIQQPNRVAKTTYQTLANVDKFTHPKLERLLWFNRNFTVVRPGHSPDIQITSDLRMGGFGYYVFEFIVANDASKPSQRQSPSLWQPIDTNVMANQFFTAYQNDNYVKQKFKQLSACVRGNLW